MLFHWKKGSRGYFDKAFYHFILGDDSIKDITRIFRDYNLRLIFFLTFLLLFFLVRFLFLDYFLLSLGLIQKHDLFLHHLLLMFLSLHLLVQLAHRLILLLILNFLALLHLLVGVYLGWIPNGGGLDGSWVFWLEDDGWCLGLGLAVGAGVGIYYDYLGVFERKDCWGWWRRGQL